ncbi:hypothetical protein [Streptomyces sp. NPDC049040]|uniref:hypothetical protein n=1 Tax=Streptomyces sp. NPDC049040 TaxID=3365593 RepID=UPI0037179025
MAETDTSTEEGGTGARTDAPYRAQAVRDGDCWHLAVESLDDHPDRGEVDALVVTVTPEAPDAGFPASELDRTLGRCGFGRDGDWAREPREAAESPEGDKWSAPCRQTDPQAAPHNSPPRER